MNIDLDLDITYDSLEIIIDKLDKEIKNYDNLLSGIYLSHIKLDEYWEGPDKDFYTESILDYKERFYHLKTILDDYSTLLKDIYKNNNNLENVIKDKVNEL